MCVFLCNCKYPDHRYYGSDEKDYLAGNSITHVYILSVSMKKLRKVQTGCVGRQCLESVGRPRLRYVTFIFVPGHAGIKDNERADNLASKITA